MYLQTIFKILKVIALVPVVTVRYTSSIPLDVCVTKECNEAASFIHGNLDTRIKPCEDFYQFACGRFKPPKTNEGKTWKNVDIFIIVEDEVMKQLYKILTHTPQENKPLQLAAKYFDTCNRDVIPPRNEIKLVHQKLLLFDGWPLAKWTKSHSWIETVQALRNIGFGASYIFRVDVDWHPKSHSKLLLQLMPPQFGFDAEILHKGLANSEVRDYFNSWLNISRKFNELSANPLKDKFLRKKLEEYVQFEVELAKIVSSLDAPIKFEIVNIKTLMSRYTSVNWLQVIQALTGPVIRISRSDQVLILPDFMGPLNKLLKKKSKKLINEYIIGRAILSSMRLIEYLQQTPRKKYCLITASEKFAGVLTSKYVREYFQENKRADVKDMARRVKTELYKSILNSDWLDRKSKNSALDKLDHINVIIGYSNDQLESDNFYNDVYKNIQINTRNSFESTLSLLKMELDLLFLSLRNATLAKVVDPLNIFEVNGQYLPHKNSIFIKAGAMQGMFYAANRPNYLNYGFVGFMIGHEFSHAFDAHNYKYNSRGKQRDWSTMKTRKKFSEKKACLVHHYGQYPVNGHKDRVNGSRTLDENMADYEGIRAAYKAYNMRLKGGTEKQLPKLAYTNQQMFWISAATMWCSQFSAQGLTYLLENSIHTPAKVRINALVSNMQEFSNDFHCPANSKMNPPKKCNLWR